MPPSGKRPRKWPSQGPPAAVGERYLTAGLGWPLGRSWPKAKAFAFLCVDSTQRSETGQVRGLRWHNRPREREGKECGEADGHVGLQRERPREGKGEGRGKVRARRKRKVKGWWEADGHHRLWRERVQGKGSEWRSASRRRQLQTRSSHHGVMPKPPPAPQVHVLPPPLQDPGHGPLPPPQARMDP